jgi:hypothetical protein
MSDWDIQHFADLVDDWGAQRLRWEAIDMAAEHAIAALNALATHHRRGHAQAVTQAFRKVRRNQEQR